MVQTVGVDYFQRGDDEMHGLLLTRKSIVSLTARDKAT